MLDVAIAFWAVAWIWVGIAVAREARGLAQLSHTVRDVGVAAERAGTLVAEIDDLPVVGDRLREPGEALREAGRSAIQSAERSERNANEVGVLLGISIALIPSLPLLVLYLPERISAERERRALERALRRGRDPALDELLAVRAVARLPYHRLQQFSTDPCEDLAAGRHESLADAELQRLGVRAPHANAHHGA